MAASVALEKGVQECIESMQDLKAYNAEHRYLTGLYRKIDESEKRHIVTELGTALFVVSSTLILKFGIATTALTGSVLLIRGEIDIPLFFMFLLVVSRLYSPLEGALQNLAAVISSRTNISRMNEILDHPVQTGNKDLTNKGYDICFDHVGFSYNTGEAVLKDVSFTAKQGEVTALVGPSGGGKTTVSRLAARFWDIQRGTITVGGMDISKVDPETLLSFYSIVFQDVTLFNNTIMENIRIGRKDATDAEVLAAARLANCEEFALRLPDGYNSMIGENGCELSGGERQRISIARSSERRPDHSSGRGHRKSGRRERNADSKRSFPSDQRENCSRHCTPYADSKRCRQGRGSFRRNCCRTGNSKELLQSGTIYPHMAGLPDISQSWKL